MILSRAAGRQGCVDDPLEQLVRDDRFVRWARALATSGWLVLIAYLAFLVGLIRRASAITTSSFEDGVWGQRFEVVAFAALPQNLVILLAAAAAAATASGLVHGRGDPGSLWISQLSRAVGGTCYVVAVIALLGIIDEFWQTPDAIGGTGSMLNRIGGLLMIAAMIRISVEAERTLSTYYQTPRSPRL
jgi:hypothetical protein